MRIMRQKLYNFLRWTQKYTGTDNVYLARGGFWLALGQFVAMAASFLSSLAFANLLDPAAYGNYRYILSLVGLMGIFTLPQLTTAITQAVARNLEGSFYTGFKTRLKWGCLGSLTAIGLAAYYWFRGNSLLPIPLLVAAIFLPLMNASDVYVGFLGGRKLFNFQIKYRTGADILSMGLVVLALFLTKNLFWLIAVYFVSNTFFNYFFYLLTKKKFKPNKEEDRQTISYGKHLSLMGVTSAITDQLDRILLFTLLGPVQLAVYYFAITVPDQIRTVQKHVISLALPKFSEKSPEEIKTSIRRKFWKIFFITVAIVSGYIVIAPYFYKILYPQYLDSVFYSQIYILSLLFTLPFVLLGTSLQAKAKKKELYILQSMSFLEIVLLVSLIPLFGIMGALIAMIGTRAVSAILLLFLFRKF